ncbi:MAG: hypothetical protein Q9224_002658 [Gallowayella concinna]
MDRQPSRQDQSLFSHSTTSSLTLYSFYIHKPSRLSRDLVIYNADDKTVAYNVNTVSARGLFSKSSNLYIYHGHQQATSSTSNLAKSESAQTPLATSKISKYSGSFLLTIKDRTIDVPLRTLGWYKFDHQWRSTQGIMRWKHGKYGKAMQLLDEKKTILGKVEGDRGRDGRICRLWVQGTGGEENKEWVDEVVCMAVGILMVTPTMM